MKTDREILEAATPGPWEYGNFERVGTVHGRVFFRGDDNPRTNTRDCNITMYDAEYMAHFDPVKIRGMLDCIETLREDLREAKLNQGGEHVLRMRVDLRDLREEVKKLREENARLKLCPTCEGAEFIEVQVFGGDGGFIDYKDVICPECEGSCFSEISKAFEERDKLRESIAERVELKPCPFCGSSDVGIEESDCCCYAFVMCRKCGARGPNARSDRASEAENNHNRRCQIELQKLYDKNLELKRQVSSLREGNRLDFIDEIEAESAKLEGDK